MRVAQTSVFEVCGLPSPDYKAADLRSAGPRYLLGALKAIGGTGASCVAAGCTLSGSLVFNNTTGAVVSVDVTMSGESPTVPSFTKNGGVESALPSGTLWFIEDSQSTSVAFFGLSTPTSGSLVGYKGGSLSPSETSVVSGAAKWQLTSGSLTPTPEPASLLLFGTGLIGLAYFVRHREKRGAVEAS